MTDEPRNKSATFAYGRRYLARADRVAVDPVSLPLHPAGTERRYRTEEGFAVFGGVRDAAPDGWGQYLIYKAMGDRTPNDIDLVLASGEHRVGALAFGPTPLRPERLTPWGEGGVPGEHFTLAELAEAVERVQHVDELDDNLRRLLTAGSSLGGARPQGRDRDRRSPVDRQVSCAHRQLSRMSGRVRDHETGRGLRAGRAGPSPSSGVLDRDIYLIERFDRVRSGNKLLRRPFASGLTMLAAHESEVSRYGYADLAGVIRQHGTRVRTDLHELFRRMVFNVLVTNDDDHLRNHGFLLDGQGWRLSPLYDVVPKPQIGLERRLVLGVGPHGRAATLANALAGAAVFDLSAAEAATIVEALCAKSIRAVGAAVRRRGDRRRRPAPLRDLLPVGGPACLTAGPQPLERNLSVSVRSPSPARRQTAARRGRRARRAGRRRAWRSARDRRAA